MYVLFTRVFFSWLESLCTHAESSDMQYKDKNGVWWNRDPHGLSYYDGEKWVRHSGSGSGSASSYTAAQPASNTETQQTWNTGPQQTSYTGPQQTLYGGQQQTLYEGQQLGPASAPDVATAMAIFPQNSAP